MKTQLDIYQEVTNKITDLLSQGIIPWHRPWMGTKAGAVSYTTRRPYSLLNQMLLTGSGEYITFNECKKLGGKIKKGAKSSMVVFWKMYPRQKRDLTGAAVLNADGEPKIERIPILRYYRVFNVKDCEGITPHEQPEEPITNPIEEGERVIAEYLERESGLTFRPCLSNRAYYSPSLDTVVVPELSQYDKPNKYYATTFHELTHSTLKESRCNREADNKNAHFGNKDYSQEELVAELGCAYLMASCGIDTPETVTNSAAYIQGWLEALINDKKMIVGAAGSAEYAAEYILTGEHRTY